MEVKIEDDFDLVKIAASGQCFRMRQIENHVGYEVISKSHVLHILEKSPRIFSIDATQEDWKSFWIPYFDLTRNYEKLRAGVPKGDFLEKAAKFSRGIRILKQDPFETLITFILSQRKSIPAIRAAVERLARAYGKEIDEELYAFPTPIDLARVNEDKLRAEKLGYRAPYVLDAAKRVVEGKLDLVAAEKFDDRMLLEKLMEVKGVGIKVATCVALFAYARFALAPIDTWMEKIIQQRYKGENPFVRFGNAAGILQQYAFFYAIMHKDEF